MQSENPVSIQRSSHFNSYEVADALIEAIISELDAVRLYSQLARYIPHPDVAKLFMEVRQDELRHVAMFLEALKHIDQNVVKGLKEGIKEYKDLFGPSGII